MIRFLALWLVLLSGLILSFILREERLIAKGKIPTGRLRRIWFEPERRRAPRYRTNWRVRYERCTNGDSRSNGKTWDVSQTGAALVMEDRLEPGTSIRMELSRAEDSAVLVINGRVVWVRHLPPQKAAPSQERLFLTGIQFDRMDPKTENVLLKAFPSKPDA